MKKSLLYCVFIAGLALFPALGLSLSVDFGNLGLGAASLGAGGVGVATASGAEALHWNPAALPAPGWDLGYGVASGGAASSLNQALGFHIDMGEGLNLGLLATDLRFPGASGFRESRFAGAASVSAGRWLSIGTTQRYISADPGGLRGWSMDAGALAGLPLSGGWALRAGASMSDAFSSLAWSSGLEELQPSVLRLGLALEGRPGWWLAFQQDSLDREGGGASSQWRAGVQAAFFGQALSLRGGATQAQGAGLYYSGGAGLDLPLAGSRLGLDYAILVPGDANPGSFLRQVVELRWSRRPGRAEPAAGLRNLIQDNGKVRHARIALADGPADTAAWELQLRDRQGRVVKTVQGRGALPPSVTWDGRDDAGQLVDAGGLSYELRTTSASGRTARRVSLLAPASAAIGGVDQAMADMDGGGFGLRDSGAQAAPVRAKPRLRGGAGLEVAGADFDLSGLKGSDEGGEWSLRIRDESGRTVKEIRGRGRIPRNLRWEGKDDLGNPVDPGLGATFEIRVTDAAGKETVSEDDLVRGERLAEARRPREPRASIRWEPDEPEPGQGSPCKVVGGEVVCTFQFEPGSSRLGPGARAAFEEAAFLSEGQGSLRLTVDGYAAEDEPDPRALSQARADAVLRRLVEGGGFNYRDIESTGRGRAAGPDARAAKLSISRRP